MIERRAKSAQATADFGSALARALTESDLENGPLVVYLVGDLGAGKTTLAQGFVRGCGLTDPVRSPTYALVEPYESDRCTVLHLDLYRLRDPCELEALGLRDWARARTVWLIEWPQKGGEALPPADVRIRLRIEGDAHVICVESLSGPGAEWVQRTEA